MTKQSSYKISTHKSDDETTTHIKHIRKYLEAKYGTVQDEWNTILTLLADNLTLYNNCKKEIEENGIYNKENGRKNPLLSTMKDLQTTILKQIQHLGISPYAASKIKDIKDDDTDDFLETLTNE